MAQQGILDLSGVDILTTGDDHVFFAVHHCQIAVFIKDADVTGQEPPDLDIGALEGGIADEFVPVVGGDLAGNEGRSAVVLLYGTEVVGVDLPAAVELVISETEPGVQGDRVSGARKPATLETGTTSSG